MYKVILFEKNNRKPVEEFILSLNDETITKILWMVNLLEYNGLSIGMPYIRKIEASLYELRIRKQENVRLIFTYKANKFYILHGFKKKKMKIPAKEIEIAKIRLTQI